MKRDVNDTERTTLAAVKALRISMCEFSDQRNAAFMSAQMKQIWTVQMISQTFSDVCFDCDDEPMRGDGCPCYWFRLCRLVLCFVTVRSDCVSLSKVFVGLSCSQTQNNSI